MMLRWIPALLMILTLIVGAPVAYADAPRGMDLLYSCTDKGLVLKKHTIKTASSAVKCGAIDGQTANAVKCATTGGQTAKPMKKKAKPKGEEIKVTSLIDLEKPTMPETSLRTGSKVIERVCGELSVKIKAGYHNPNPQGLLGAVVYPVVSVTHKGSVLVDDVRLGNGSECELADVVDKSACHKKWAKKVSVLRDRQKFSVLLARDFVERQDVTVKE